MSNMPQSRHVLTYLYKEKATATATDDVARESTVDATIATFSSLRGILVQPHVVHSLRLTQAASRASQTKSRASRIAARSTIMRPAWRSA